MKDYTGDFNPDLTLQDLDHDLLAQYGRDIMLANHIHDRSALLPVALKFGIEAQTQIACDEWMSTSPIYNYRNRQFLNIEGDDVSVALKGFQLDIGAPHNYLNFHYELVSPGEGYFWTSTCGPFNHVYKMSGGDEAMQTQICHHMEDPTFDATVIAVNPQMRCKALYRPPVKTLPEKGPCKWQVVIQDDIALAEDCPFLTHTSNTLAARFEFDVLSSEGEGMDDYSGDFQRDFCLERLTHGTLTNLCKEFMLDVFLLNYGCHNAVAERHGEEHIIELAQEQYHHLAPITVHRLRQAFSITGTGMDAILKVLQLNPFTPHDYFDLGYAKTSDTRGLIWLNDCAGYREPVKRGIASLMTMDPEQPGFHRMAQEVNPQAAVSRIEPAELSAVTDVDNVRLAWEIIIDPAVEPATRSEWADVTGQDLWDHDNRRHVYLYEQYDAAAG
ncbi:hypothetical protein EYC98_10670 [Halieaceae bacterium IMCC14734]|uniref:Uncharacterized protein n=1 Tax=Candidatus Litorirhabdus singularis TaxID=2518993 RepID=A0ABT3TG89_9GAMM|nr:hypothetical protein [Candidatus Litorirhabdus singularis]MCX2981327.1 hypothetical protein [Candidatus Litorirhabdus singularis]